MSPQDEQKLLEEAFAAVEKPLANGRLMHPTARSHMKRIITRRMAVVAQAQGDYSDVDRFVGAHVYEQLSPTAKHELSERDPERFKRLRQDWIRRGRPACRVPDDYIDTDPPPEAA